MLFCTTGLIMQLFIIISDFLGISYFSGSFQYPQHMFWLKNKNKFNHTLLLGGLLSKTTFKTCISTWNPRRIQRYHGGVSSIEYNKSGPEDLVSCTSTFTSAVSVPSLST